MVDRIWIFTGLLWLTSLRHVIFRCLGFAGKVEGDLNEEIAVELLWNVRGIDRNLVRSKVRMRLHWVRF
jgi:hypothetical protein